MLSREDRSSDFISIVVSDATLIHTQLLAEAMRCDPGLQVVAAAARSKDLLEIVERVPVDVVVISYVLEDVVGRGPELLREMRTLRPQIKGVVLLDSSRPQAVLDCFRAGANGIFSKHEKLESLCKCIRCVHEGQIWASSAELKHVLGALANSPLVRATNNMGIDLLSARERQVVQYLAAGMSNREIAKVLGLSPHTIKNYLFRIFDKLGVSTRTELLFLTLSQNTPAPLLLQRLLLDPAEGYDEATLASCQTAAEHGVVAAQLALARILSKGRPSDRDLIQAYMWFCVAIDEVTHAKNNLKKTMSSSQLAMGELRAREWLNKTRKIEPSATTKASLDYEKDLPDSLSASGSA